MFLTCHGTPPELSWSGPLGLGLKLVQGLVVLIVLLLVLMRGWRTLGWVIIAVGIRVIFTSLLRHDSPIVPIMRDWGAIWRARSMASGGRREVVGVTILIMLKWLAFGRVATAEGVVILYIIVLYGRGCCLGRRRCLGSESGLNAVVLAGLRCLDGSRCRSSRAFYTG